MDSYESIPLLHFIVEKINVGIFSVNKDMQIVLWNKFMEINSGKKTEDVLGKNLFSCFPELSKPWLSKKIKSVFILKNFSFTSWESRPYLFKFRHNRPITGDVDFMRQDCTFLPVKDVLGDVKFVCIALHDVTDISIYQTKLQNLMEELQVMSVTDALTSIYNRGYLEDCIAKEFERAKRYGGELSLIIFDIDYFKKINDGYGHVAGDEVLKVISANIKKLLRNSDVFGRYGGEEFCIVTPGIGLQGAMLVAERIRQHIEDVKISFQDKMIPVTVSIGVAEYSHRLNGYEDVVREADSALYVSKKTGRNRVSEFTPPLKNVTV